MSYNKRTWANGNVIGAVDLNRMEQGVESGQNGYECTEESTVLTDETVTTTAQGNFNRGTLSYSQLIDADTLTITFDGVEYECPRTTISNANAYGGVGQNRPDFSQYPFEFISTSGYGNTLVTETVGTYSIKIEIESTQISSVDPCFTKAVKSVTGETAPLILDIIRNGDSATLDHTFEEIKRAYLAGRTVLLDPTVSNKAYSSMTGLVINTSGGNRGGSVRFGDSVWRASTSDGYPVRDEVTVTSVVSVYDDYGVLNTTAQDIQTALSNEYIVYVHGYDTNQQRNIAGIVYAYSGNTFYVMFGDTSHTYTAASDTDYPSRLSNA